MPAILSKILDLFLHIDENLALATSQYGTLIYGLLFLVVFMETGFVVTPFLPGDSLLFASGALGAVNYLNIWGLYAIFLSAAILGDTLNYWVGHYVGPKISKAEGRFIKKEYFVKAQKFYEKHGNIAIVLARFIPILRTFAPFVAGVAQMSYFHFILYNIIGGVLWVSIFLWGGFIFGNIPYVQENFHYVVLVIIFLSLIPIIFEVIKSVINSPKSRK